MFVAEVKKYLRESVDELKMVEWPTRKEALNLTLLVFAISILVGLLVGFFDLILLKILDLLIS